METRKFPGVKGPVSALGFGLMRLPMMDGEIDYETSEKMVDEAIAGGVNYFDTAWIYHGGLSETVAGRALSRHPRSSYNVATKSPTWLVESADHAERIFEEQLKKLKTDYVDFYLIHNLNSTNYEIMNRFGLYDIFKRKKESGLIRHLGCSVHDGADHVARLLRERDWDFFQIQLNYLDWIDLDAKKLHSMLTERKIPIVIMEPVRGGFLAQLPKDAADGLAELDPAASQASWALRFAASLPGVMTVLSGMSSPEQMSDNLKTFNNFRPISEAERVAVEKAAEKVRISNPIPCTSCRYCMDCPSGVNIPMNFAVYNLYKSMGDHPAAREVFHNNYRSLGEPERADKCAGCGECATHCPQSIEIPDVMKIISEFAAA